jgi:Bifunctional DNA primase/polymerase, N-terminal
MTFTSTTELTTALQALPQSWALTPVNQKKAYFGGWQQTGLARGSIEQEITSNKADGFGILTGELSGGLIAIDCDGHKPHARFTEILGGEIPETVSFASGKDGRAQYLYSVPQEHWASIATKKEGDPNEGGQLEWRWSGCYSVLPPSAHPETDGYYWVKSFDDCEIAELPEKALEHLQKLCKPKDKAPAKPAPKKAGDVPPIPLERCLSNAHRQALESGAGEGNRSNTAISLARDLLGCAAFLDVLDEPYSGDPQSLYFEYCDRCSPPIDERERAATWRSANNYSPEPSISDDDAFQNCIDKWKKEHGVTATERPVESNTTPLMDDVTAAVKNLSGAGLTAELAGIAKKHDRPVSSIEKMATQIQEEIDRTSDDGGELRRLLTAQDFDPISALSNPLRELLAAEATRWSLPTIGYVASLLTVALSVTKTTTRLWAMNTEGKPVIWLGLVGTSNSGKSESLNTITRPL